MIEKIGKSLVYAILVFSLLLLTFAWGILGNQINWPGISTAESGSSDAKGLHAERLEQIAERQKDFVRLRLRWKDESDNVAMLDLRRDANKEVYRKELAALDVGGPIKQITYKADGSVTLDGNERPVLAPNADERLTDRKTLDGKFEELGTQLEQAIKDVNALIKEQEQLTLQLRGVPGKTVGLLPLLEASERDKYNAEKELAAAREEAINGRVAVQALQNRRVQLEKRVKELREFNLAQRILP